MDSEQTSITDTVTPLEGEQINFCPDCRNRLESQSQFCNICGKPVKRRSNQTVSLQQAAPLSSQAYQNASAQPIPSSSGDVQPEKTTKFSSSMIALAVACGVLLIVAIALIYIIFIKPNTVNVTLSPYPSDLSLMEGTSSEIRLVIDPERARDQELIWVTSNTSVATVENGLVNAIGEGECRITVALTKHANIYADIAVTVTPVATAGGYDDLEKITPEMVYPNAYLSEREVSAMDLDTLQFYINTIYAKNGYIFSTPSIASYFEAQPWYTPRVSNMDYVSFNDMDNSNLNLLIKHRGSKNVNKSYNTAVIGSIWSWALVQNTLSERFVSSLSSYDIQLLINTIYAKNGYIFQMPELQALFETQYWYSGWTDNARDLSFSKIDQANLALLGEYK